MVTDYPDFLGFPGRAGAGEEVISYSFSGGVDGESTGYLDLPVVATGYENVYQCIAISCNDDSAIHNVIVERLSDTWVFFEANFITGDIFDFPGQGIAAGGTVRVIITNNSAGSLTFEGSVFYTTRPV